MPHCLNFIVSFSIVIFNLLVLWSQTGPESDIPYLKIAKIPSPKLEAGLEPSLEL